MHTNTMNPGATVDAQKVLQLVQLSSVITKRAMDELGTHKTAEKQASAAANATLKVLLSTGTIAEHQKEAAAKALGNHTQTLALLQTAATKLASFKNGTKQAGALGRGEDDPEAKTIKQADDSLRDPFVGQRAGSGQIRASDAALFAGLGLAVPRQA